MVEYKILRALDRGLPLGVTRGSRVTIGGYQGIKGYHWGLPGDQGLPLGVTRGSMVTIGGYQGIKGYHWGLPGDQGLQLDAG